MPAWIKRKREAPHAVRGVEPQFLHIRVTRALERIHARSSQQRPKLLEKLDARQQFVLNVPKQRVILNDERVMEINVLSHVLIMHLGTYVIKDIIRNWRMLVGSAPLQ